MGRVGVVKELLKISPFAKAAKQDLNRVSRLGFILYPFIFCGYLYKGKHFSLISDKS